MDGTVALQRNEAIVAARRFGWASSATLDRVTPAEWAVLVAAPFLAATCEAYLQLNLRLPGHAILRVVFPLAVGLALAPRRQSGAVMSSLGVAFVVLYNVVLAAGIGLGAMTSLALTGPVLEIASRSARPGWRLYLRFAAAGLLINLLAFAVRWGAGAVGVDRLPKWQVGGGWPLAAGSYALCGAIAGLVSAAILFRWRDAESSHAR